MTHTAVGVEFFSRPDSADHFEGVDTGYGVNFIYYQVLNLGLKIAGVNTGTYITNSGLELITNIYQNVPVALKSKVIGILCSRGLLYFLYSSLY